MLTDFGLVWVENIIPHVRLVIDRKGFKRWYVPERSIEDHELVLILGGNGSFTVEGKEYPVRRGMNSKSSAPFMISTEPGRRNARDTSGIKTYCSSNCYLKFFTIFNNPPKNYANIQRVEKALDYIKYHYKEDISTNQLCSLVNLSAGYFSFIFKEVTGETPLEYIHQIRIDHSKELLITTSLKIKEIAAQVSFKDEFYFTRVFKKIEGYSPSEFRQRFIKDSNPH